MRSNRMFWILLLGLFGGLLILVVHHEQGEVAGIDIDRFGHMVSLLAIGIFIGGGIWAMFRGRIGESLLAAAFWVVLAGFLAVVYTYREPLQQVGHRVMGQLVPGYAFTVAGSGKAVTLEVARASGGEFAVRAAINGAGVSMLVDTGASSVVLTHEAAQAAGLPMDFLKYDVTVETANGRTKGASVLIDNLIVGGIVERRVPALVMPKGILRTSLLGMTFLSRLEAFEFRGDRLLMRGAAS